MTYFRTRSASTRKLLGIEALEPRQLLHGDGPLSATAVGVDSATDGHIEMPGDVEWYSFNAIRGVEYILKAPLVDLNDSFLTLYDQDGTTIITADDDSGPGRDAQIVWQPSADGRYYVEAKGFADQTGTYQLIVIADDHCSNAACATPIEVPSKTSGEIRPSGNADWFRFEAVADTRYVMTADLDGLRDSGLRDSILRLYDQDGTTVIQSNDNGGQGRAAEIVWDVPATGVYFAEVSGMGSNAGTYKLEMGRVVVCRDPSCATSIEVPSSTSGEIQLSGDVEWFRFEAIAGGQYTITASLDSLRESYLKLYDRRGTRLIKSKYVGPSGTSLLVWEARASGNYLVQVSGFNEVGTYVLEISFVPQAGDANTDQRFDQLDIIQVLQGGKYLAAQSATWEEGDWTGDGKFDQRDIIAALQSDNYLQGQYAARVASRVWQNLASSNAAAVDRQ